MASKFHLRNATLLGVASIALIAGSGAVIAQTAQKQSAEAAKDVEEVVVTGTLIRGVAPVGSNVVGFSKEQIEATGASNTAQLLGNLPQVTNLFNNLITPGNNVQAFNFRIPVNRPNVRNLPLANGSGGAQTLVLVDGHRIVGMGIEQLAVDPDVVPPSVIERVETILDGGSAIYGSDAIGGVMNFITKRKFDGTQADARYGFADKYSTFDANVTSGKAWDKGSFSATYSFGKHDALYGRDRDYVKQIDWNTGIPTGRTCDLANVTIGASVFAMPNLTPGFNSCDLSKDSTFYAAEERHSGYAIFTQDISDTIKFDLNAYYSYRKNTANPGPFTGSVVMRSTNPYYRAIAGFPGAAETVQFSYAPVLPKESNKITVLESGQVTPTVTVNVGDNWQVRGLVGYGRSKTAFNNHELNTTLQTNYANGTTFATAINPYDIAATQNKALFGDLSWCNCGDGKDEFLNARVIADGTLFALPGGNVNAAIGAEYYKNDFNVQRTDLTLRLLQPRISYSQNTKSVFGELRIPIVGKGNGRPGIEALTFSASGRYDSYNDFGDTFNPKLAVTYDPVDWITLRGNWGKSFNAPSAADQLGVTGTNIRLLTPAPQIPADVILPPGPNVALYLSGVLAGLKPQKATNWSIGGDIRPPIVPNLTISTTYYYINFSDIIAIPTANLALLRVQIPGSIVYLPTPAQIAAFAAIANGGAASVASANNGGQAIVELIDQRTQNLGVSKLAGLDFSANYSHPTSFGSLFGSVGGNYQLRRDSKVAPAAAITDDLANSIPLLLFSTSVGANVGNLRAQATWNHTSGYVLAPSTTRLASQTRSDAFDVVNLSLRYNVDGSGLAQDLALTLNVNNLLDQDPPVLKDSGSSGTVGSGQSGTGRTLGRLVQIGISKKF